MAKVKTKKGGNPLTYRSALDVSAGERVRGLRQPPTIVGEVTVAPKVIGGGDTPEQKAVSECAALYGTLTKAHPDLLQLVAAVVGIRRMYAVAYRELLSRVEGFNAATPASNVPPQFADFVMQYGSYVASRPFSEHDLMTGIVETVLPWLGGVVDAHVRAENAEAEAARSAELERRKASPIPLPFKHTPTQEDATQPRERSVVFVGWKNAVRWVLDRAVEAQAGLVSVRLCDQPLPESSSSAVRIGRGVWAGCANGDREMAGLVVERIEPVLSGPPDVIVVDDLGATFTGGFFGRSRFAQAGDGHRRLRKLADAAAAGLVCGLPTAERTDPDTSLFDFEQLKTFTDLRPVRVQDADDERPGHYRLVVGVHASVHYVPKAVLDAYSESAKIIV